MSFATLTDLNWLAVIVAALAYFAIGAVWYAPPVFGRAWTAAGGMTVEPGDGPGFAVPLMASVLSAIALGMLAAEARSSALGSSRQACEIA